MGPRQRLSVQAAIQSLFPEGYLDYDTFQERVGRASKGEKPLRKLHTDFSAPPLQAVDLFAIAGYLLLKSGGYHHVSPEVAGATSPRMLVVTEADRKRWRTAGEQWRRGAKGLIGKPPAAVTTAWSSLMSYGHVPLYRQRPMSDRPRPWWKAALTLLAIADEAAKDIGFGTGTTTSAQAAMAEAQMRNGIKAGRKIYTLSQADSDLVCVLPKSRTPKVGCTLRSLSHNLALLPSRSLARAYWSPMPRLRVDAGSNGETAPFNLLIIPAPFRIRASAFKGTPSKEATWGWFHVEPHWCPASGSSEIEDGFDRFQTFVNDVITAAERDVGAVHGLVFPEAALSYEVFERLTAGLSTRPNFELLVSGLFDARDDEGGFRDGNFAAMARRVEGAAENQGRYDISTREKHHRWRVERSQIETYALGSALDAGVGWWERIDILSRSLDVFVLRGGATVTTLICEDLARNDPCQELVRGIGPNLVIALLMDGPQLKDRWPARYATVLAEDPGSSVLTVTSLGLIHRTNESRQYPPSDKIALWRDDSGRTVELSLPSNHQALCLTLQPTKLRERTLDGRDDDNGAQSWRLTGIMPVAVEETCDELLNGLWPSKAK